MLDEAIGTLGLSPDVFWLMTYADFIRALEAWVHNHNQAWDRTRYQSAMIANCAMGRKKTVRPKDLFKLPHDNIGKDKIELPSKEEIQRIINKPVKLPI